MPGLCSKVWLITGGQLFRKITKKEGQHRFIDVSRTSWIHHKSLDHLGIFHAGPCWAFFVFPRDVLGGYPATTSHHGDLPAPRGGQSCLAPVNQQLAIENCHRNRGFTDEKLWFSMVVLVYQRVPSLNMFKCESHWMFISDNIRKRSTWWWISILRCSWRV